MRIAYTTPAQDFGTMAWEGREVAGPLPPRCAEHRAVYDRLIVAGVEPEPYRAPPEPVPPEMPLFKVRYALSRRPAPTGQGSLLDALRAAIQTLPDEAARTLAAEALDYANTVSRGGVLAALLRDRLGLSEAELDGLFRQAQSVAA